MVQINRLGTCPKYRTSAEMFFGQLSEEYAVHKSYIYCDSF